MASAFKEEEEPKMRDLIDLRLKDWKKVGRTLGFPESALNEIETCSNERDQYNSKKIKLFKEWKVKYARKPMNRTIVQALIDAGEHEAAHIFCQKHGIDQRSCNSALREKPKEPVHSLGQLNVVFSGLQIHHMRNVFSEYMNADVEFNLLMEKLQPDLLNCNWNNIIQEIQYNDVVNLNFYPCIDLDGVQPELAEIVPILFRGKSIFTKQITQKYSNAKRLKKIFTSSLNHDALKQELPRSWYLVVCILYSRGGIISLQQYEALARECCVPENEIGSLLNYVHTHFGLLLHFADAPGLEDLVICSIKDIFKKCCILIEHIVKLNPLIAQSGLASKSTIDRIVENAGNLELKIALQLLKYHCLVVEPVSKNVAYFFPFLLQNYDARPFDGAISSNDIYPAPLLIRFSTEKFICVFHSLHGCLSQYFQLNDSSYSCNKMSFILDSHIKIELFARKNYIEIQIFQDLHSIDSQTLETVISIIVKALQTLAKVYETLDFGFKFYCPGSRQQAQSLSNLHFSELTDDSKLRCCNNAPCRQLMFDCQDVHLVWNLKQVDQLLSLDNKMEVVENGHFLHDATDIMKLLEARLDEEGGLPFHVVKSVFYGPPFCGKTTACRRLTGKLFNLSENPTSCGSTGIDEPITLNLYHDMNQTSVFIRSSQNDWSPQSVQQQIEMFVHYFVKRQQLSPAPSLSMSPPSISENTSAPMESENSLRQMCIESSKVDSHHTRYSPIVSRDVPSHLMPGRDKQISEPPSEINQPPPKCVAIEILKDLIQNAKWEEIRQCFSDVQGGTLLSMIDTGGQAEFHDILPLLIRGPSLFLMFLKLDQPLDEPFPVSYRNAFILYKSIYTPREVLHQLLALCDSLGEESAAMLIGSYKDKVTPEQIDKLDASIQDSLRNTEFFKRDFLKMYAESRYLYALDNMNGGTEEIEKLQAHILNEVKKFSCKTLPVSWGLLHLLLKYVYEKEKVCSLKQATEIAVELKIAELHVPKILEYIDRNFGTILYYNDVPCLQDTVICDPSVVFEPIAKLVAESFGANPDAPKSAELIRKSGNIPFSIIEKICRESNTVIPIASIIEILKHRGIVLEIEEKKSENMLFMPCLLLPDPSVAAYDTSIRELNPAPLIFSFSSGYVPVSLFNTLVIKLSSLPEWSLHNNRFKNRMEFLYFGRNPSIIEIISRISFLEIRIVENYSHQKCFQVHQEISREIKEILSSYSHMKKVSFLVGFYCPNDIKIDDNIQKPHPAVCMSLDKPCSMVCNFENCPRPKIHTLQPCHKIWFEDYESELMDTSAPDNSHEVINSVTNKEGQELVMMEMNNDILQCDSDTIISVLTAIQELPLSQLHILGLLLGISKPQTDRAVANNDDSMSKYQRIATIWLETGRATWRDLVDKLKHSLLKQNALANAIEAKHVNCRWSTS